MRTADQRQLPLAYRFVVGVLRPLLQVLTKRQWSGMSNIPAKGGFVVCPNHLSHIDVLALGHFMYDSGRPVYLLGKESIFRVPVVGWIVAKAGQIPVYRGTARASDAYREAVAAVRAGLPIGVYPEGSLTRDPDIWPMRGKTGAARIALETRAPVIPVAMWGPQELLVAYSKIPRLWPRKTMRISAGAPVDLSDLYDAPDPRAAVAEATSRIMAALTQELADIRGEVAPARRYDPAEHGESEYGKARRRSA